MSARADMRWSEDALREFQFRADRWKRGVIHTDVVAAPTCRATVPTISAASEGTRSREVRGGVVPVPCTSEAAPSNFARLCVASGLPAPRSEYRFHYGRRWRFDYAWPAHLLALEIEGGIWTQGRHTRGSGALADLEKYSEAAILGWRIIYCTPSDLQTTGMDRVARGLATGPRAA